MWAPVHAWRALGLLQLRDEDGYVSDWTIDELPQVFGMIGPAAVPELKRYVAEHNREYEELGTTAASGLREIAENYPESRAECVAALTDQLAQFSTNAPELNGFIIGDLIRLKAVESAATIKAAFYARRVDLTIAGNWKMVKADLGLDPAAEVPGPEPADEPIPRLFDTFGKRSSNLAPLPGPPARRRSNKAAKAKRKQEKKSRKLNRKRK